MTIQKAKIRFVAAVVLAHTTSYLLSGGLSYQFITKEFWDGSDPLLGAYLRTPGKADLWHFAMLWQIPGQVLRSVLIGFTLLPLFTPLRQWSAVKRFLFMSALLFVLTHFSSAVPSPANIEGFVYMKPEFVKQGFLKMQVEMILYSLVAGLIFTRFAYKRIAINE